MFRRIVITGAVLAFPLGAGTVVATSVTPSGASVPFITANGSVTCATLKGAVHYNPPLFFRGTSNTETMTLKVKLNSFSATCSTTATNLPPGGVLYGSATWSRTTTSTNNSANACADGRGLSPDVDDCVALPEERRRHSGQTHADHGAILRLRYADKRPPGATGRPTLGCWATPRATATGSFAGLPSDATSLQRRRPPPSSRSVRQRHPRLESNAARGPGYALLSVAFDSGWVHSHSLNCASRGRELIIEIRLARA